MINLDRLIQQIRRNCDISDAHHGGIFSVCGLALRLRDLYKWEQGLSPWEEGDSKALLKWIGDREEHWETLIGADYGGLALADRPVDPFDTETVNAVLADYRLLYGAGYAQGLKPTFFLATIEDCRIIDGYQVYRLGRELARDLLSLPALSQGTTILLRSDAARRVLWDQLSFTAPSGRRALRVALNACGLADGRPAALRSRLADVLAVQETMHLRHELGEIQDKHFDRDLFREIVAAFPLTRVEILARHVKDLLADTNSFGTLRHVCLTRSTAGLGLYIAFADRLTKALFPHLESGFEAFLKSGDWATVEHAVERGYAAAAGYANMLISAYLEAKRRNDLSLVEHAVQKNFSSYMDGHS